MSAKSAPQLLPLACAWSAAPYLRGVLVILALAMLMGGAGWLFETENVVVAAVERTPVSETAAAQVPSQAAAALMPHAETPPENGRYWALAEFLAKRYKVSRAVTFDLVTIAHAAGQQIGLDPLLIIAVMAVESRFNPIAESVAGAKGLMQVIPKYHTDKFREFGGEKYAVFDPETNILVGSHILKEYLARTGSVSSALQLYVGSPSDDTDTYTGKVMNEKQRLQQILRKSSTRTDVEASIRARSWRLPGSRVTA